MEMGKGIEAVAVEPNEEFLERENANVSIGGAG